MRELTTTFIRLRESRALILMALAAVMLFLTGCEDSTDQVKHDTRYDRLYGQISQFQTDPQKIEFLAEESVRAGVRSFKLVDTNRQYGRASSNGQIELSTALRGGTGLINITHEIAHVAGFRRGCDRHTRCWIVNYLEIAKRFELLFPGETWSGTTPTLRVLRNVDRFRIRM